MTNLLERPREASIVSNPKADAPVINPPATNAVTPVMGRRDEFERYTIGTSHDEHRSLFDVVGLSGDTSVRLNAFFPYLLTSKMVGLTRFQLLEAAGQQLTRLVASGEAKPSLQALASLNTVVTSFAADGGPTPQLAATPSSSVELAWVVGGQAVGAIFADDGTYSVWAQDADGKDIFEVDVDDTMPPALRDQIVEILRSMSGDVQRAVPIG